MSSSAPPPLEPAGVLKRILAFYLPQYHPIPENDAWWGQGSRSGRTSCRRGRSSPGTTSPTSGGPRLLRPAATRDTGSAGGSRAGATASTASATTTTGSTGGGSSNGRSTEVLATGEPDFPFCLCWANENWTRTLGRPGSRGPDSAELQPGRRPAITSDRSFTAFDDPRYIRVDGKPVFIVYKAAHLPDARRQPTSGGTRCVAPGSATCTS